MSQYYHPSPAWIIGTCGSERQKHYLQFDLVGKLDTPFADIPQHSHTLKSRVESVLGYVADNELPEFTSEEVSGMQSFDSMKATVWNYLNRNFPIQRG
jgi:hypothetical protein